MSFVFPPSPTGTFLSLRKPATACSSMSTMSPASRRPFGKPALSPPSTPIRLTFAAGIDGLVDPQLVREGVAREGHLRDARAEHRDEVVAARLRDAELVQLVEHGGQDRGLVVLLELRVLRGLGAVPEVLQPGRDDDLVDQRVAEAGDLRPARVDLAVHGHVLAVGRRPDADRVRLRCRSAPIGICRAIVWTL